MSRHLRLLEDLDPQTVLALLEDARALKAGRSEGFGRGSFGGKTLAMIFDKASTRTRVSFEVAAYELGGNSIYISRKDSQLGRGETPADTAQVLGRFVHAIAIRTFEQRLVDELAEAGSVPVINALTDLRHPCQLLTDMMLLQERFGSLEGLVVAWVGDGNNMANSWIAAAAQMGFELRLACPEGYDPDLALLEAARKGGAAVSLSRDPAEACDGAHAINADTFASMGQEDEAAARMKIFEPYRVDAALMDALRPEGIFMHCLPAHRGEEVTAEVFDGPRSVVFDQAENRLHTAKAILRYVTDAV